MGRKRKLEEADITPSPGRVTRSSSKQGTGTASPNLQDGNESTRLGANIGSLESSDDDEVFSKHKKPKSTSEKDLRKKGSAKKLMLLNADLVKKQKDRIRDAGFGGLLDIKYSSVHEKMSAWLVRIFDTEKLELVIPFRGSIKVDAQAVHRIFGIPMGKNCIEYMKKSGADSFLEFYKLLDREDTQKAPTFKEAKEMLLVKYKGKFDDTWLKIWLLFAVSSLLCPTSSPTLCIRAFHAMFELKDIKDYNWCQLVVDRLVKGIQDFKLGKKFLTGCLFFLTVLYLDSLDIPNHVDQRVLPRVSVWTEDKVAEAIALDKLSDNDFGKLRLKEELASTSNMVLIQPERIEEFINANFAPPSLTVSKDQFKQALFDMSTTINQAVFKFCSNMCQIPWNGNTSADTGMGQQAAAGTSQNAAALNTEIAAETQQVHTAPGNLTLVSEALQGCPDGDSTIPPGKSEHVVGAIDATATTEPAANTQNIVVSNTTRCSTELVESDDHTYSEQQQEVSKGHSTERRASSAGGSTEILGNPDDSCSVQLKEGSGIVCEGKQSGCEQVQNNCEQVQREKVTPLKADDGAGSSEGTRNNCEINNEYSDLSPLDASEKSTIHSTMSLHDMLETPSKDQYPQHRLEEYIILESPLQPKAKRMLDDLVDAEFQKASHNSSLDLELTLPPKEKLEHDLLGSLFSSKVSLTDSQKPSNRKRNAVAKLSASNVYARKVKFSTPNQVAPEVPNSNEKATCGNVPSKNGSQSSAQIVKNLMTSDAFKAAPDAPSFDLGIDSPTKSQGSITDSMFNRVYDEAMIKSKQKNPVANEGKCTVFKIYTSFVSAEEREAYYMVCKYKGKRSKVVTSPLLFKCKQVSAHATELANSIAMGKCLSSLSVHVGTSVLFEEARQSRKLIMSPWVSIHLLDPTNATRKFVEKTFHFLNTEYDLICFPILESNKKQAFNHWWTFVINLKDSKFHVIDSLRPKTNLVLVETANKVIASATDLWNKVTSKHEHCTLKTISNFKLDYVEGYRQFGIHDCGLFTLKAIEFFDGKRLPEFIDSNESHLRMQILHQWLNSPANQTDWKAVLFKEKETECKLPDKTSNSLIDNPVFFSEPRARVEKTKHLPETLLS